MLISFNWLKKHINLNAYTAEEVAAKLKASTVEIESVEHQGKDLDGVVVGKIVSAGKHPNADKLKLCKVDVGGEQLQIVCGGSNVESGMLVAVAKVGAKVKWHGEGDLIELAPVKIRDVESFGMICASTEIGLGELFPVKEEKEILDLSEYNFTAGTLIAEALKLNDAVIEIDNKSLSNRPDLWGHYGIARETAVLFNRDLNEYQAEKIEEKKERKLTVEVEDVEFCPRYMAVCLEGIKVAESPDWLKQNLASIGLRSINNIVDITNYIMMDLGQPLHAFDAGNVLEGTKNNNLKIIVRKANEQEDFAALDSSKHKLNNSMLVIASNEKVLAVAGVMGGLESGVSDSTTSVVFESANFNAASIRKTSGKLGLRTDSAVRFEKSLDPNLCEIALRKAVELTMEVCPEARVVSKIVDKKHYTLPVGPIEVEWDIFRKKLGVEISNKDIVRILEKLGFQLKQKKSTLSVKIPTWRATKDVSIAEDLVEEVARIYGYDAIPSSLPLFSINPPEKNKSRELERKIKNILSENLKYTEVYNYSFVSEAQIKNLGDDTAKYIELDNPLSKERPYLRRNLLPNILDNLKGGIENNEEVKIFEIGRVFTMEQTGLRIKANSDELLPKQDTWLTAVFSNKKDNAPFWQIRKVVETIFSELHVEWGNCELDRVLPWEHPTRLNIFGIHGIGVGVVHEVHPAVTQKYGIDSRVGLVRLNLDRMVEVLNKNPQAVAYRPLPIYPEVHRDIAFLVNKRMSHLSIVTVLKNLDPLLKDVQLFDVYEGKNISEGYKSMAYRLTYARPDRTLTNEDVEKIQQKVMKILEREFNAEMRK